MSATAPRPQLPFIRGAEDRRLAVLHAKRRLFGPGLAVVALASAVSVAVTISGQTNYPGLWAYVATNVAILSLCLSGLLALRNPENVTPLERVATLVSVLYVLYWDVTALASHYHPKAEFLMTSVAEYLLAATLLSLVVPRQYLIRTLALFFILHETLTWANLLQFPWSGLHNSQLMSDLVVLVTTLGLSLISTYQHMIATTHHETDIMQLLVNTDAVTGLANSQSLAAQLRAVPRCAVLLIQVDPPDQAPTEAVTIHLARLLREVVGTNGSIGRRAEHEFVILLPYASTFAAQQMAQHVRTRLKTELPLKINMGVAVPAPNEDGQTTLTRAELHLRAGG